MAKDYALHWIGGAAFVVGVLVLGATTTDGGAPRTLALPLGHNHVRFASTQSEAIAMASSPAESTKVASRAPAPRRSATRVGASVPAGDMSIAVATVTPAVNAASSGGNDLVRALRAHSRDLAIVDPPAAAPCITCPQVDSSPPSDVLLAARPQRGPPLS